MFQESRSREIVFDLLGVLTPVEFNDEPYLQADEIDQMGADAVLAPEFPATQAAIAQLLPERAFRLRLLTAQSMLS